MRITTQAMNRPKRAFWVAVGITAILLCFIPLIHIDTDPENMLSEDEAVRIKHNELKEKYRMYDILVVGIINEEHEQGVFNKKSLTGIYHLAEYLSTLQEQDSVTHEISGVISSELMTPNNVDHISPGGQGSISFDWLMKAPPATDKEALAVRDKLLHNDLFRNTMVSEDGQALCLYVPLSAKDESHRIASLISNEAEALQITDDVHITGLPVAEDTFGIEMFIQMAFTAPAAMLCIFILLFLFFRKVKLIFSPMIVAMLSVLCTMGLLIACGFTVHIMSSMIPIFVMPIAVLDSVHILSEFFDRYSSDKSRRDILEEVMSELQKPMLFTSLTSAAGFASLALTPIPPVQVFGVFVAIGILLAWLFTISLIPAYILLMKPSALEGFGRVGKSPSIFNGVLSLLKRWSSARAWAVVFVTVFLFSLFAYGITKIVINDNPVKWFTKDHPVRVADRALNKHFGGTYMAFLSLSAKGQASLSSTQSYVGETLDKWIENANVEDEDVQYMRSIIAESKDIDRLYETLTTYLIDKVDYAESDEEADQWEMILSEIELLQLSQEQIFKNPEVLNYIQGLSEYLQQTENVGKVNGLPTLVEIISQELNSGDEAFKKIPKSIAGVGQSILSFQGSHHPEHLLHYADAKYQNVNLWLQLKSGDNKDMEQTIAATRAYFEEHAPPVELTHDWYGLTYINVIWQNKMVQGMLKAFLGSFLVVFIMMCFLFRSIKWAAICMLPLSITIVIIYGAIGWIGKDYDMPVAVLSSLALGLAVDFSIHFLVRAREQMRASSNWSEIIDYMFAEPSRAISRNVIVIAIGFLPLLLSSLIPYRTVGLLLASILFLSGIMSLLLLPSVLKLFQKHLN